MWSCDRSESKNSGPIVHVLNGDYPEADVGRMSLHGLEKLVAALVRCTSDAADRPKWWPNSIAYNRRINLGLNDEREIKLALKQLIVNCSQFFKERPPPDQEKRWCIGWSDENHQQRMADKRRAEKTTGRKRHRPLIQVKSPVAPVDGPTKHQFLRYFRLNSKQSKRASGSKPPPPGNPAKLTICTHIPFSSDVGRIMAAREQHRMPDDLKLKRLERSEWYTNKGVPRAAAETEFELVPAYKESAHCHWYKMPRRQFHQRRLGMHDAEFLSKFCTPVYVSLDRLDVAKVRNSERRQLVVMIDKSEKMCCDVKTAGTKIVRTSPRLRNV